MHQLSDSELGHHLESTESSQTRARHAHGVNQESGEELMNFGLRDQLEALRWIQERLGR